MAILGTLLDRSMDYDLGLWTNYNASFTNAIGATIISSLLCFAQVSMYQCVRAIYFSSIHYYKHIICFTNHYQQHISNMLYRIFKICIILLYCYFTMLCSNLSKCNFNVVMKLIRADTKYILLEIHYEVVLTQSANHRHSCSIQVSSNSIQHPHVPLQLIMSHN